MAIVASKLLQGLPAFGVKPEDVGEVEAAAESKAEATSRHERAWRALLWALLLAFLASGYLELGPKTARAGLAAKHWLAVLGRPSANSKSRRCDCPRDIDRRHN